MKRYCEHNKQNKTLQHTVNKKHYTVYMISSSILLAVVSIKQRCVEFIEVYRTAFRYEIVRSQVYLSLLDKFGSIVGRLRRDNLAVANQPVLAALYGNLCTAPVSYLTWHQLGCSASLMKQKYRRSDSNILKEIID